MAVIKNSYCIDSLLLTVFELDTGKPPLSTERDNKFIKKKVDKFIIFNLDL